MFKALVILLQKVGQVTRFRHNDRPQSSRLGPFGYNDASDDQLRSRFPADRGPVDVGPVDVGMTLSENPIQNDFPSGANAPNNVLNGPRPVLSDSLRIISVWRIPLASPQVPCSIGAVCWRSE